MTRMTGCYTIQWGDDLYGADRMTVQVGSTTDMRVLRAEVERVWDARPHHSIIVDLIDPEGYRVGTRDRSGWRAEEGYRRVPARR